MKTKSKITEGSRQKAVGSKGLSFLKVFCLLLTAFCLLSLALFSACQTTTVYKDHPRLPKVALVLGGGAARGYAHIGVLKVLEEENIPIDMIVGTSAGSIVGALYASGLSAKHMEEFGGNVDKWSVADFTIPKKGLIKGDKLESMLNQRFKGVNIEHLRLPFAAVAADLKSGRKVVLRNGPLTKALRASCSVPGVFIPVEYNGMLLIDGGVVEQVPVDTAKELGADIIIAVDISRNAQGDKAEDIIDVIMASIDIMGERLTKYQCKEAQVLIAPEVGQIGSTDFTKKRECILAGQLAATKALPAIYQAFEDYGQMDLYGKVKHKTVRK